MATSKPSSCDLALERGQDRADVRTAVGRRHRPTIVPPGKNRSVRRTAPSLKLRAASISPRSPTSTSVEPPPMSTRISRWSNAGTACSTPRWISRASSNPEMTSMSTSASRRARLRNTSAFCGLADGAGGHGPHRWRCALRRCAACGAATRCRGRSRRATSSFMSPPPWPSRTVSFSRVTTSKPLSSRPGDDEVEAVGADVERRQGRRTGPAAVTA